MQFNDKQNYLEWRQQWKDQYETLTGEIRQVKFDLKHLMRTEAKSAGNVNNVYRSPGVLLTMQHLASGMMIELKYAKNLCKDQYNERIYAEFVTKKRNEYKNLPWKL